MLSAVQKTVVTARKATILVAVMRMCWLLTLVCLCLLRCGGITREELYRQFYAHRQKMGDPTSMRSPEHVFGTEGSGMVRCRLKSQPARVVSCLRIRHGEDCGVGLRMVRERYFLRLDMSRSQTFV